MKSSKFIELFQIEKHGVTNGRITILHKIGRIVDRVQKIEFYKSMGHRVFLMDGTEV